MTRRVLLSRLAASGLALGQTTATLPDPVAAIRRDHPRLILPDADLARVRALVREHPLAHRLRDSLEREAEKIHSATPVDYKVSGQRISAQSRRVADRIYTLTLLYRLNEEPRHRDRALKELRAAALFPNWNPAYFPDVAEMTHAFAIGYDWLYASLNAADRDWIREAIVEKGLEPALTAYREPAPWVTAKDHWNLVCNSGVSIGALAVATEQPERARRVLGSAFDSIPRGLSGYAPDGGWAEGPGYWNYASRQLVCLLASLESAMDDDRGWADARGLDVTGKFRVYCTGPTGKTFNYGDSTEDAGAAPEMFWLARRFEEPVYAWHEQMQAERASRPDPLDLVWFYKEAKSPKADDWPMDILFSGVQAAFLRSSWDDPNALFLAVKGGDNKANRAHLDLGTFVLEAGGIRWAYDPGPEDYNAPGYLGKQRFSYFKAGTSAHNTVMIDGESQDHRAEARVTRHEFGPDLSWIELDLSRAYPGKVKQFQRRIGIAQKQAVLIQDSLSAEQPVEPLWGLMTDAEITFNGQSAELKKNDWTLACEIRSPRHAVFDVVANQNTKKLVARVGQKITDLDLTIVLTPYKTGQTRPVTTKRFPV